MPFARFSELTLVAGHPAECKVSVSLGLADGGIWKKSSWRGLSHVGSRCARQASVCCVISPARESGVVEAAPEPGRDSQPPSPSFQRPASGEPSEEVLPVPAVAPETVGRPISIPSSSQMELILSEAEDGDSLVNLQKTVADAAGLAELDHIHCASGHRLRPCGSPMPWQS